MALILAVDTTNEFGSLALARDGATVAEVAMHAPAGFGQVLYGHLERLLAGAGATVDSIDCFAAASGPGSFTGVRIGLACVKGLAEAAGKPAVAVSNLQALAWFGRAALRAVVLDARRGEVYGAVYDAQGSMVSPEVVVTFPVWLTMLPAGVTEFVAADFAPYLGQLAGTRFAGASVVKAPRALAVAIASIAAGTRAGDPAGLDANYVRRSDAELFWKDQAE
jgi:tRNA threonylcarbamoyladenosine biosynthesis protein TsaB